MCNTQFWSRDLRKNHALVRFVLQFAVVSSYFQASIVTAWALYERAVQDKGNVNKLVGRFCSVVMCADLINSGRDSTHVSTTTADPAAKPVVIMLASGSINSGNTAPPDLDCNTPVLHSSTRQITLNEAVMKKREATPAFLDLVNQMPKDDEDGIHKDAKPSQESDGGRAQASTTHGTGAADSESDSNIVEFDLFASARNNQIKQAAAPPNNERDQSECARFGEGKDRATGNGAGVSGPDNVAGSGGWGSDIGSNNLHQKVGQTLCQV